MLWALATQLPNQSGMCRIEGTVSRSGSDVRLSDVEVVVSQTDVNVPIITTTDTNGHFVVDGLEPGRYSIRAERSGYMSQIYGQRGNSSAGKDLVLGRGQGLTVINFQLVPTGVISGRVLGEQDEPLVGFFVEALTPSYIQGHRRFVIAKHASTNDLGEYRIYGLAPGRYYVIAFEQERRRTFRRPLGSSPKKRYVPTLLGNVISFKEASPVDVLAGTERPGANIWVLQKESVHVRGRLVSDLRPLPPMVDLNATEEGGYQQFQNAETHVTTQGNFEFDDVLPGSYTISTQWYDKGKNYRARQRVEVRDDDIEGLEVALSPGLM